MEEIDYVAKLKYIEVSNFKSFKDVHLLGPFQRNFMAVVGCNGAGNNKLTSLPKAIWEEGRVAAKVSHGAI